MGIKTKRKNTDLDDVAPKEKVSKLEHSEKQWKKEIEFDVKHFHKEIKFGSGKTVSLFQFLQVCSNSHSEVDYLKQYLDCGGSANEILKQINEENKKNPLVVTPVFNILQLIFTKIQTSYHKQLQQAEETCRYFLNTYISTIDFMLSDKSNARQQKITLQLLTAIVTLNSELAFTVLNQLSLQPKTLIHLVKRQQNVKEKDDVRKGFIYFLMSFLVDGNTTLVKAFLDKQGLVMLIVPELFRDKAEVALVVLELLKKHVISNQSISKTIKIRTFNHMFIANMFNLFNWKGANLKSEEGLKSKSEIEESVCQFLSLLFTSHKYGVYFTDKYLGTGDSLTNQHLWKAIECLEAPWYNERAGTLLIEIVSLCPDLNKPILHLIEQSFEPRHSEQWTRTINFVNNFFNSLPANKIISLMTELNPTQITNFVRNVYLPSKILQSCVETLNTSDMSLKNQIILLLNSMLSSVKSFLIELDLVGERFTKVKSVLKNRLDDFIPKHFPSTDHLISILHSALDNEKNVSSLETDDKKFIPPPASSIFVINILDVLLIYNEIIPNSLDPIATMLDSKRLLEHIETLGDCNVGELKLKIVMFLLGADKFAFSPDKPLFKEILHSMFDVYIGPETKLSEAAKNVLRSILETSGVFERNLSEIDLFLSVVYIISKDSGNIVPHVVNVILCALKHFSTYSDLLSSICDTEMNDSSLQQYHDIYFENLDTDNSAHSDTVRTIEKYSLTPFFVSVLNYKTEDLDFIAFSKYYLTSVFHNQEDPKYFYELTKQYELNSHFKKYVNNWMTEPSSLSGKLVHKSSIIYKLSSTLVTEDLNLNLEEIFGLTKADDNCVSNVFVMNETKYVFSPESVMPYVNLSTDLILFFVVQQHNMGTLNSSKFNIALDALHYMIMMASSDCSKDNRNTKNIIEKCLIHKTIVQKFTPFCNGVDFITRFIMDFVSFCAEHNIENSLVTSLLKTYRHKVYMSLLMEVKKCNDTKNGVLLNDCKNMLSCINLMLHNALTLVKQILKMDVACMLTIDKELSSWLPILCHIIKLFIKNGKVFSNRTTQSILLLYYKIIVDLEIVVNLQEFEECILQYLQSNPECILNVPHKVFKAIFSVSHVGKSTSNIGSLLLQTDSKLLPVFKTNIIKNEIMQKRELVLPLANAAFNHEGFASNIHLLNQIYDNYKSNIMKILEKPHKASQIYIDNSNFIVRLIDKCMDSNECDSFCKKIVKYECFELFHLDLLDEIYFKAYFNSKNPLFINNYLMCILQLVNIVFKKDISQIEKFSRAARSVQKILLIIYNHNINTKSFETVCDSPNFQSFFKNLLKTFMTTEQSCSETESSLFNLTSSLIHFVYPQNHPSITNMFDVTTSHSEFLNILLSNRQANVKTDLVKLLLVLTLNNKEVMKASLIPVYLSAYHASMRRCDRYLLCLLKLHESNGHAMNEYQPYLWGDIAANHYAVRSKRTKSSLWSNPTANHILNLLDKEIIEKTVKQFSIKQTLDPVYETLMDVNYLFGIEKPIMKSIQTDILNKLYTKKSSLGMSSLDLNLDVTKCKVIVKDFTVTASSLGSLDNDDDIYDPAFMLPLLNFVVSPGSAVSTHRIIRGGVLSIPFVALSSLCPVVRAAAFNILHRFYVLLESEMYYKNDKVLWSQFIETLKSSLKSVVHQDSPIPKLSTLGALYLARSAIIMTHPIDPLFKPINNFVISKQYIDFSIIPDFLDLFHNTDITYIERRTWMLKLLRDGIKHIEDINVVLKSVAFKMLLDFYSSSLCDSKQKYLILETLNSCILIPKAAKLLVEGFSLFTWLGNVVKDLNSENKKMVSVSIKLISNLWFSLAAESNKLKYKKIVEESNDSLIVEFLSIKPLKLADYIQSSILNLLTDIHIKLSNSSAEDVKVFMEILNKYPKSKYEKSIDITKIIPVT